MAEQRLTIKAAEFATSREDGALLQVETAMLSVAGGKATVFGLFILHDPRSDVRDTFGRIIRGHLEHAANAMAGEANVPRRFEAALADVNAALHDAANEFTPSLTSFEAVVGVLTDAQLFVSGIGNLHALFLHKTADRRFVIYELNEQFKAEAEASWEKPFITVLDGELQPGDIFYVATRAPSGSIALAELQDILITLPPQGALQRIRQFLPHDASYGALCFHVVEQEKSGPPKKMNPIASLTQLGQTKSDTAGLLGEQGTDITGIIRRAASALGSELSAPGSRGYKSMIKKLARAVVQIVAAIVIALVEGLRLLWRLIRRGAVAILNKQGGRPGMKDSIKRQVARVQSLPPASKFIALGIVAVVAILTVSVVFMQHRGASRKEELAFQTAASRIEEKTTAAEASLIYDDVVQARTLLTEAAVLLETLPNDNRSHQTTIDDLQTNVTAMLSRIRRIETVTPTLVAELTDGNALASLAASGGTLYAVSNGNELYRVNELGHSVENQTATNGTIGTISALADEGSNLLFLDSNGKLGRADLTAKTLNPVTSGADSLRGVNDLALYNGALYILSAVSQQITKMRPQGSSYEAGTNWISERASDLTGAVDLAIDGNVYVATNTDIVRFKSNREVPWEREALDPAMSEVVDIWTNLESPYLYILMKSEGGRIVVYNKDSGKLVTQYSTPEMAGTTGFVVREAEKQIVFATDTKIWSFSATHLLK